MNNEPAQEEVQHTVYLNVNRNWTSEKRNSTYFEPKVFFLKDGRIGMEYGGIVIVKSIELWTTLAKEEQEA